MVLEYKFDYHSSNNKFVTILDNLLKEKEITYKINKEDDVIFLYIEDEEDRLLEVSNELASKLPMSIFLKDFTLEVVPQIPKINYNYSKDSLKKSYCQNCLTLVENNDLKHFYNPFIKCSICGTTCDVDNLDVFENKVQINYKNYKELFELLALKITQDKKVRINEYVFSKFEKLECENQKLLCTNLDKLSTLVVSSKQKSVALLSLEKPSLDFNVNTIYQSHNNCDVNRVNISSSWDMFLYLLSKELQNIGIDFLVYEKSNSFDIELDYEEKSKRVKISLCENKTFLLENNDYDKRLDDIFNKLNEKSKSQFLVLVDENNLYEKSILNIYISSKYEDAITLYSPKIDGMLDVLKFELPKNINLIFDEIAKEEGGKRLLDNYKEKFPKDFLSAINLDISRFENNSISSLWKIISVILGIDDIFNKASQALLQKGPRVDYKLLENEKIFNKKFNLVKLIRSGISFKLAGVDEKTLSLGYVESFVYFLSNLYDEVNEAFPLDGISFSGDLIANEFFYRQKSKAFNKNLKLYYNKDFPIQL